MLNSFFISYLPFVFDYVIETSMMASVLVGLILFVKGLLRNRLTPRWHYLLWIILIVRLLLPWSPDSSYSIFSPLSYDYKMITFMKNQPVASPNNEQVHETKAMSSPNIVLNETSSTNNVSQILEESREEPVRQEKQKDVPLSFYTIASYIWFIGVIVLGFITYLINKRLHYYIQKQPVITEERVVKTFKQCQKSMFIQKEIPLLLDEKTTSPTVFGFFRPKVLLSSVHLSQLDEQQLQHIFYHELAHIKRKDVGVNWLMHSLLLLNWFNPILWYAHSRMREDQEIACDALALTFVEEKEQISYGHTIISLLEQYSYRYPVPGLANLSKNKRVLKRRILMIKKFHKSSYRWSALGVAAVITVSLLSLLTAHADGTNTQRKNQTAGKKAMTEAKKEETVYTPPKQAEYFEDMTKEEILTKMLNTVDNFETAKGEFEMHYADASNAPGDMVVSYELSLRQKAGGYSKTAHIGSAEGQVFSYYYHNGTIWDVKENEGAYTEMKYESETYFKKGKLLTIQNAFSVDSEGNNVTDYRERPPSAGEHPSLFPYEIASNYTRNLNSWEIEKQNEELLGHNTLVIKGTINKRVNKSFRFWVDKDTGILVKYETYDAAGKVADYLYPTSLEINVPINSERFIPNLKGYQKEEMFRADQPHIRTGNIDSLIPEALKAQWEEVKKRPNETKALQHEGNWYIQAKKGYLVNNIEVNGKEGTLFLAKASPQKAQFVFHALAEGYQIETLKIIYE